MSKTPNFSVLVEQAQNPDLQDRCAELLDLGLSDTQADQRGAYVAVMAILVYNAMRSELGDGYAAGFYTGALDELLSSGPISAAGDLTTWIQLKGAAIVQDANIASDNLDRQRLTQENQRLRECLNTAAGLLFRLEEYRCINTDDPVFEDELEHWRHIGRDVVKQARTLLNTDYPPKPESPNE